MNVCKPHASCLQMKSLEDLLHIDWNMLLTELMLKTVRNKFCLSIIIMNIIILQS